MIPCADLKDRGRLRHRLHFRTRKDEIFAIGGPGHGPAQIGRTVRTTRIADYQARRKLVRIDEWAKRARWSSPSRVDAALIERGGGGGGTPWRFPCAASRAKGFFGRDRSTCGHGEILGLGGLPRPGTDQPLLRARFGAAAGGGGRDIRFDGQPFRAGKPACGYSAPASPMSSGDRGATVSSKGRTILENVGRRSIFPAQPAEARQAPAPCAPGRHRRSRR